MNIIVPHKGCTLVSFLKRVLYVKEVHGAPTLRLPPSGSPNGSFLTVTWIALYIKNMDVDLLHLFIYFTKFPNAIYLFIFQNYPNAIYLFLFLFSLKKISQGSIDLLN
jgi:hypothetical protein